MKMRILYDLKCREGLLLWDKVYITDKAAKEYAKEQGHYLPRKGREIIHARQRGIGDTFIGKDENGFYIGLC